MKKSTLFFGCLLALIFLHQTIPAAQKDIEKIRRAIAEKNAKWTAAENWVTQLSPEQQKRLCGAILRPRDPTQAKVLTLPKIADLPAKFDWRNNNGNWITPVKNQGNCPCCFVLSAVAQTESWWKIHHANPDSMIDLSEQFVISCADTFSVTTYEWVFEFLESTGTPSEACFKYQESLDIPCSNACDNWQDEAVKIPGWGYVTLNEAIIDNIKNAVYRQPVSTGMEIYSDFNSYSRGVYEHVYGNLVGGHVVLIIGWNDEERSWICKNSWGANWGEKGYFRIKWDACSVGTYALCIWDQMTGGPALAANPTQLDFSLTSGDSTQAAVTITNSGQNDLEFSTMDYQSPVRFHLDDFMAWDGLSWWCGDRQIGGYDNRWLQYLDTPILDLSKTASPRLTWMGLWKTEDPHWTYPNPVEGYDGCNVWISVDGGGTFQVADPTYPKYDYRNISAFSGSKIEGGWDLGDNIAGWAGSSNGWVPVEFDLTPFKSAQVIIRFAFASDYYCSHLPGFFVDDIKVSHGDDVLFEDHGNDATGMRAISFGMMNADWLKVSCAKNMLSPDNSTSIELQVKSGRLEPGEYQSFIRITANDSTIPVMEIPVNLKLSAAAHDMSLKKLRLPGNSLPLFARINPLVEIKNCGRREAANFDIICSVARNGQPDHYDTTRVPLISPNQTQNIHLNSFSPIHTGVFDFLVTLANYPNDGNPFNNRLTSTMNVTNLVDGFETESSFWTYEGGWGISNAFSHSGTKAVHVNNGKSPYQNNMNATLTHKLSFDYHLAGGAILKYWTKYQTEKNKDLCYLEASRDSLNWTKIDSLSGLMASWQQRQALLPDSGNAGAWIRFHFISDAQNTMFGVLIDDVEIYSKTPTGVGQLVLAGDIPGYWDLAQNYPNPFNPITAIRYDLPKASEFRLVIYDLLGRRVKTIVDTRQPAGHFQTTWDGTDDHNLPVAAGVYFCRMEAGNPSTSSGQGFVKVIKLALVK